LRWKTVKKEGDRQGHNICGESFFIPMDVNEHVTIMSPGYDTIRRYPKNKNCMMQLVSLPSNIFKIDFIDLNIKPKDYSINKCNDYLRIREGASSTMTTKELLTICGSESSKSTLFTSGNKVMLSFFTDNTEDYERGFKIRLTTMKKPKTEVSLESANGCGGHLFGQEGSIVNPSSLISSSQFATCVWTIRTEPSTQIQLNFNQIDLPGDCDVSYVILREGDSSDSKLLGKYCSYKDALSMKTTSNRVWMEYKTPVQQSPGRFAMTWSQINKKDTKCGGSVSGESGYLRSPSYPETFTYDRLCLWNIMAKKGEKVSIDLQDMRIGIDCKKSYVTIRDGMSSESRLIGKYCPNKNSVEITSTGSAMWVEVKATCGNAKAFKAFWRVIKTGERFPELAETIISQKSPGDADSNIIIGNVQTGDRTTSNLHSTSDVIVVDDVSMVTGDTGSIQSPLFPSNYPADTMKAWSISGPPAGRIRLEFRQFALESDILCRYDFVEIRDGKNPDAPLVGRFCGKNMPAVYESSGNSLWVKFKSDSLYHNSGFKANWKWIDDELSGTNADKVLTAECGGEYDEATGVLQSPSYPKTYPPNAKCFFILETQPTKNIRLDFKAFELEKSFQCRYDYLEIRDGRTSDSRVLAKLCGNKLPNPIISTDNALYIKFVSDRTTSRSGFKTTWRTI